MYGCCPQPSFPWPMVLISFKGPCTMLNKRLPAGSPMASDVGVLTASEVVEKKQQAGNDGSTISPYSSAYSSDTEDLPIKGLVTAQSMPLKSVEDLRIVEEEEASSFDGTSMDDLSTRDTSRNTSFDERQAYGSPQNSLSPSTSIFTFSAPQKSLQDAEQMDQKLKLARLLLTRGKVGETIHSTCICRFFRCIHQPRSVPRHIALSDTVRGLMYG